MDILENCRYKVEYNIYNFSKGERMKMSNKIFLTVLVMIFISLKSSAQLNENFISYVDSFEQNRNFELSKLPYDLLFVYKFEAKMSQYSKDSVDLLFELVKLDTLRNKDLIENIINSKGPNQQFYYSVDQIRATDNYPIFIYGLKYGDINYEIMCNELPDCKMKGNYVVYDLFAFFDFIHVMGLNP